MLPNFPLAKENQKLLHGLKRHLEKLYFMQETDDLPTYMLIELAYRLNKPQKIVEILEKENLDNIN
jgi:hypothetical protein